MSSKKMYSGEGIDELAAAFRARENTFWATVEALTFIVRALVAEHGDPKKCRAAALTLAGNSTGTRADRPAIERAIRERLP